MTWLDNKGFRGFNPDLLAQMREADEAFRWVEAASARELTRLAIDHLSYNPAIADAVPADASAIDLGNMAHLDLISLFEPSFPNEPELADKLADQIQLYRAFSDPTQVVNDVADWVKEVVEKFPQNASRIKVGDNAGDVLDPFILAANFELLSSASFTRTIETTVSHKVLMMIEDLVGNMHQRVLSRMRGNFRVPEPQRGSGGNKEVIVPWSNPFPGADVGQVPLPEKPNAIRLFQVKNKTGSASGSQAVRLGNQLNLLEQTYGAQTFYIAVVGNTLRGHRSMGAVKRVSPETAVLVGRTALREICRSDSGAELLLRTYRKAFREVAHQGIYDFERSVLAAQADFQAQVQDPDEDFIDAWLDGSTAGLPSEQDTRLGVYPIARQPRKR